PPPRWRPVPARPRPRRRAHRSGRASPASGSTGPSRATSRRRSRIALRRAVSPGGSALRISPAKARGPRAETTAATDFDRSRATAAKGLLELVRQDAALVPRDPGQRRELDVLDSLPPPAS